MSTRLRPIVMLNDTIRAGGNARRLLEETAQILRVTFPPRGSMPEADRLVQIFQSLPLRELSGRHLLWLFREPKNTSRDRSRYAQLCEYYGLAPSKGKKKKLSLDVHNVELDVIRRLTARQREEQQQRQVVWGQATANTFNQTISGVLAQYQQAPQQQPTPAPTTQTFSYNWESIPPYIPDEEP